MALFHFKVNISWQFLYILTPMRYCFSLIFLLVGMHAQTHRHAKREFINYKDFEIPVFQCRVFPGINQSCLDICKTAIEHEDLVILLNKTKKKKIVQLPFLCWSCRTPPLRHPICGSPPAVAAQGVLQQRVILSGKSSVVVPAALQIGLLVYTPAIILVVPSNVFLQRLVFQGMLHEAFLCATHTIFIFLITVILSTSLQF